jgi:hypothetical protein
LKLTPLLFKKEKGNNLELKSTRSCSDEPILDLNPKEREMLLEEQFVFFEEY